MIFCVWTLAGILTLYSLTVPCKFNPARDFAPRLVAYAAGWRGVAFRHAWLYVLAPICGAPLGGWAAERLLGGADSEKSSNQ